MRTTICTCDICRKKFGAAEHRVMSVSLYVYDSNHVAWEDDYSLDVCPACVDKVHDLFNLDYSGKRKKVSQKVRSQ